MAFDQKILVYLYTGGHIKRHRQIFGLTFWSVNDQPIRIPRQMIPHMKALIFSSSEPEGQRAWPPNKAATPTWMKFDRFHLKGRGGFVWRPRPLSFWLRGTEYQGFQMRYNTSFQLKWFSKYEPSKLNDRKKVRLSKEIDDFFVFSTLAARIFGTTGSSET